jgi:outer membrane protein TolC
MGSVLSGKSIRLVLLIACRFSLSSVMAPCQSSAVVVTGAPNVLVISLDEAIQRAEANQPAFATAVAQDRISQLERSNARATLLPSATYHNQYLFTQGSGTQDRVNQLATGSSPRFIANNAVHEYASEGVVNETIGLAQIGAVRLAEANAAVGAAELEVARRGLISTVVTLFYEMVANQAKLAAAGRAKAEADDFVKLTEEREAARESAHADVVKAQLEQQQRTRALADLREAEVKARLELGVLLYPDPRTDFKVDPGAPAVLPDRKEVDAAAARKNPEIESALASLHVSEAGVYAARACYFPDLSLNYTYGIDAPQFAVDGTDQTGTGRPRNLGYSTSVTLDIPVWDWLSSERKVKQSEIRRDAAKVAVTAAQARAVADLEEFYGEAATARDQLASLDQSVATAQESLRLTSLRYNAGDGTVLEVVDAQNALTSEETARADGMLRFQVALAQLQTLTGRF